MKRTLQWPIWVCTVGLAMAAQAQPQPTIKIGQIESFSGPTATAGETFAKTFHYAVDLVNARGGVLGRKLEVVPLDNAGDPAKAVSMLSSAVDQKISIVAQAGNSSVAGALLDAVDKHNARNPASRVLYLNYGSALPDLTGAKCSFWLFRFEAHQRMKMNAIAEFIKTAPQIKKVYLINQDYQFGKEVSADARTLIGAVRPDIEFVGDDFHPFGRVKDFAPYILKIKQSGADTVLTGNWGNDLALLVRASRDAGLKTRYITYHAGLAGMPTAIGPAGEDLVYQISAWHPNVPVEENQPERERYQREFRARFGEDLFGTAILAQVDMLAKAIEKAGSATDVTKIATALEGMDYASPFGQVRMRKDDHQATHPIYVSQLVKGAKYDADGIGLGWKTVAKVSGQSAELPSTCRMSRPD